MNFKKTIVKTSLVLLGTLALSLLLTSPTLASTVGTTPVNTATTSSTSSKTPAVTTQPVVLTTAEQAAALAHTTGTQVTPPETVTIDPSVTSSGTVVDETKNTSATSGTTSPTTTGNTGTTGTSSSATTGGTVSPTPSSTRTVNPLISLSPNQDPKINSIKVTGSINNDMTGSGVMDNVEVTIDSKNIKADNLLTPDGLHWSSDTTVVPIHETALGTISDQNFPVDGPTIPATAYTFNPGDSGRITDVGQTLSGLKLDMLYTVVSNDTSAWQAGIPDLDPNTPQGLAFTGEQNIVGADGNSIVALYYGTNQLDVLYQIVVSGTVEEVPVLASFITTDIDNGQGVTTNLNNILTITPNTTNLQDSGTIKYDTTNQNLNGASSLPYGGYLGVGFESHFDYHFYSPAPAMSGTALPFSEGVRYDLFGSSLQAHLITQTRVHGHIYYYDNRDTQFHTPDDFIWWDNVPVNIPHPHFDDYDYTHEEHRGDAQHPELDYHYNWMRKVTLNYYGEDGTYLGSDTIRGVYGRPYSISAPSEIGYYELESASNYSGTYGPDNQVINVIYRYVPPITYYYTSNPSAGVFYANGYEYVPVYVTPSYQDYSGGGNGDSGSTDNAMYRSNFNPDDHTWTPNPMGGGNNFYIQDPSLSDDILGSGINSLFSQIGNFGGSAGSDMAGYWGIGFDTADQIATGGLNDPAQMVSKLALNAGITWTSSAIGAAVGGPAGFLLGLAIGAVVTGTMDYLVDNDRKKKRTSKPYIYPDDGNPNTYNPYDDF